MLSRFTLIDQMNSVWSDIIEASAKPPADLGGLASWPVRALVLRLNMLGTWNPTASFIFGAAQLLERCCK